MTDRITIDPDICHGKPTIRGLRYPVEMILELLTAGMSSDEILAGYEDPERERNHRHWKCRPTPRENRHAVEEQHPYLVLSAGGASTGVGRLFTEEPVTRRNPAPVRGMRRQQTPCMRSDLAYTQEDP